MRKLLSVLLATALAFSLCACTKAEEEKEIPPAIKNWDDGTIQTTWYDKDGNLIKESWAKTFESGEAYDYVYDANGIMIFEMHIRNDGVKVENTYENGEIIHQRVTNPDGSVDEYDM